MGNTSIAAVAIALGVIAIILGILFLANVFGIHPTRGYAALAVGAVLLIVGIVSIVATRSRPKI